MRETERRRESDRYTNTNILIMNIMPQRVPKGKVAEQTKRVKL